jgi:hypothetical protein
MARLEEYSLLEQVVQMLGQNDEKKFARLIEMVLNCQHRTKIADFHRS